MFLHLHSPFPKALVLLWTQSLNCKIGDFMPVPAMYMVLNIYIYIFIEYKILSLLQSVLYFILKCHALEQDAYTMVKGLLINVLQQMFAAALPWLLTHKGIWNWKLHWASFLREEKSKTKKKKPRSTAAQNVADLLKQHVQFDSPCLGLEWFNYTCVDMSRWYY